jgi:O-antigen biosynthesis protein WbqP
MSARIQTRMLRLADLILAGPLLVLTAPVVIAAGIVIRLGSPGPALFRQVRVGRRERPFVCLKLRTMALGTATVGTHEASPAAVTPAGRILRRLKIDELPQLWNVLRGEMSLVGPRPCLPVQTQLIEERRRRGVYEVRPGITGRGQTMGLDMSTPVELATEDAVWAAQPRLDEYVRLIAITILGRGRGDAIRG